MASDPQHNAQYPADPRCSFCGLPAEAWNRGELIHPAAWHPDTLIHRPCLLETYAGGLD